MTGTQCSVISHRLFVFGLICVGVLVISSGASRGAEAQVSGIPEARIEALRKELASSGGQRGSSVAQSGP